jgi:glycerol-3-phosphate dehydrogenase
MQRQPEALADGELDLLVIGGGITGAGVALDAVTRGLRVGLIDKGDFAGGTSSASSKLVHGGLRYLERGDLRLVHEALRERARLLRNVPHLVWPLRFVLPFYHGARVPPWKWRAGLALYDLLAGTGNIRRSRSLAPGRVRAEFPEIQATGLAGGGEFYDAQMDDARLCLAVVRTAALQGAVVANYVEVVRFESRAGRLVAALAHDQVNGQEFRIRARQFLNAAGPWGDGIRQLAGEDTAPLLRPTKGVHVIAPGPGPTAGFLLLHPRDGRVFFVLPWLGKTLLGTTDTDTNEPADALTVAPAEIAYLLDGYNYYFDPGIEEKSLLGRFVGVRPLLRVGPGEPSSLPREFRLVAGPTGLMTVAGGKYTTYRHMAEVATDRICGRLGLRRHCRTRTLPLDGAPDGSWHAFEVTAVTGLRRRGIGEVSARHLVRRYGVHAFAVASYVERDPSLAAPVSAGEPDLRAELIYQRDEEMAVRREDYLFRRTRLGLFTTQYSVDELVGSR